MYQVAICDDDMIFANSLKKITQEILSELGIPYEITIYNNAFDLLRAMKINPDKYNLLLLDIRIREYSGIKLAKILREKGSRVSILFMSNSKDYALEGYAVYPIHYMLKPVQKQQMLDIINKEYREKFLIRYITVPEKGGSRVLELNNILYIEVINRKILIHTIDKDFICTGILKDFLQSFPDDLFVQCHKSFVVNISKVIKVSRTSFLLKNEISIPVGRVYYQSSMSKFISYIEKSHT